MIALQELPLSTPGLLPRWRLVDAALWGGMTGTGQHLYTLVAGIRGSPARWKVKRDICITKHYWRDL